MQHRSEDLVTIFNQCFSETFNTRLQGGAPEPLYLPASDATEYHQILFAHDYFASALHEVAHWCIAGDRRRMLVDYGYWYAPDGRNAVQQKAFEDAEITPQALEWIFSEACAATFRVSVDNLAAAVNASGTFTTRIAKQAQKFCTKGISQRPQKFIAALAEYYGVTDPLNPHRYRVDRLT